MYACYIMVYLYNKSYFLLQGKYFLYFIVFAILM